MPFNSASYSLLTEMSAHQLGLAAGEFSWTGGTATPTTTTPTRSESKFCVLRSHHLDCPSAAARNTLFDYTWNDLQLLDNRHHPAIAALVAVSTRSIRDAARPWTGAGLHVSATTRIVFC
ncbi:thymidylate synthase [Pseudarthrobacter sp. NPDC055928]|uniref:thymidylate synthase n=1 Tax=Pseudarthrobacter sp. NPDC055928 TaxID=3345661 RepID=UPI0035E0204F